MLCPSCSYIFIDMINCKAAQFSSPGAFWCCCFMKSMYCDRVYGNYMYDLKPIVWKLWSRTEFMKTTCEMWENAECWLETNIITHRRWIWQVLGTSQKNNVRNNYTIQDFNRSTCSFDCMLNIVLCQCVFRQIYAEKTQKAHNAFWFTHKALRKIVADGFLFVLLFFQRK